MFDQGLVFGESNSVSIQTVTVNDLQFQCRIAGMENEGDGVIYVKELTIDKYDKLFSSDAEEDSDYDKWHDGEGWSNEFPLKHTIPEWFTEFEKTLLLV